MFSTVAAADACLHTYIDNPISGYDVGKPMLAELARNFADKLYYAEESDKALTPPCLLALETYCNLIQAGNPEYAEPLARLILECNHLVAPNILNQLAIAYSLVEKHKDDVPVAIWLKVITSGSLLDCCSISKKRSNTVDGLIDDIGRYTEEFDSLSAEEKAISPYAAAEMWNVALAICFEERRGDVPAIAEKIIESIRRAHENGAAEDVGHMMMLATAYRNTYSDYRETYRRMASDAGLWSEPLLLAIADFTFCERVFKNATESKVLRLDRILPEDRSDAAARIEEAIQIAETYSDVTSIAPMLPNAYWIRSVLKDDIEDKKLACYYAIYFSGLELISREEADDIFETVFATVDEDSPLHSWYEELIKEYE